jgi:hypothetical protein
MSCCGSHRTAIEIPPRSRPPAPPAALRPAAITFVYTGATRLIAEGAVTRQRYRFEQTGAAVEVDARDAPAFAAIPNLHRRA